MGAACGRSAAFDDECPVCLEPLGRRGALVLACGHRMHAACLLQWQQRAPCAARAAAGTCCVCGDADDDTSSLPLAAAKGSLSACGHHVHHKCLERWLELRASATCPLCRAVV